MKSITCDVIGDLLPLYVDSVCSDDSKALIEEHLENCPKCRAVLDRMGDEDMEPLPEPVGEKKILHSVRNQLLAIGLALFMIVGCFIGNWSGAWAGGPAAVDHLLLSIGYVLFWIWFCLIIWRYSSLVGFTLGVSIITFAGAALGFVLRVTQNGGFLSGFFVMMTSVPFYGFRYWVGWTEIYGAISLLALGWMLLTARQLRRLKAAQKN